MVVIFGTNFLDKAALSLDYKYIRHLSQHIRHLGIGEVDRGNAERA